MLFAINVYSYGQFHQTMVLETMERDEELNSTTIFLNYTSSK